MAITCEKHHNEVAGGTCRSCCHPFCPDCLVYPKGQSAPPLCIPCALVAGGVRASGGRAARRARRRGGHEVGVNSGKVKLGVVAVLGAAAVAVPAVLTLV